MKILKDPVEVVSLCVTPLIVAYLRPPVARHIHLAYTIRLNYHNTKNGFLSNRTYPIFDFLGY